MTKENILGKCSNDTHTTYKGEDIDEETFEYHGCWKCPYFTPNSKFPYYDVKQAAKKLNISEKMVIKWIKNGLLHGRMFERQESKFTFGPNKRYFIDKEDI